MVLHGQHKRHNDKKRTQFKTGFKTLSPLSLKIILITSIFIVVQNGNKIVY